MLSDNDHSNHNGQEHINTGLKVCIIFDTAVLKGLKLATKFLILLIRSMEATLNNNKIFKKFK